MARVYLASSWRNVLHGGVLSHLRRAGHDVYDFKNPMHGTIGFAWDQIGLDLETSRAREYRELLYTHPVAARGYVADMRAMEWADACVLLLPCGRSAHLEAGWFCGRGKRTVIFTRDGEEPELMALMAHHICVDIDEVLLALR